MGIYRVLSFTIVCAKYVEYYSLFHKAPLLDASQRE